MVQIAASIRSPIPLTLTLSLREREQRAGVSVSSIARPANTASRVGISLWSLLPLPKGEGWGEGKVDAACPDRISSSALLSRSAFDPGIFNYFRPLASPEVVGPMNFKIAFAIASSSRVIDIISEM